MKLYHVMLDPPRKYKPGYTTYLDAKVPEHRVEGEEGETARICCASTIYQCMLGLQVGDYLHSFDGHRYKIPAVIFQLEVPDTRVIFPNEEQVPDAWWTGEVWVPFSAYATVIACGKIRRMQHLGNSAYSRFSFTCDGEDEVIDRLSAPVVYGELKESFCWVDDDPSKYQYLT